MQFVEGTAITFITQALTLVLVFATSIVLARLLKPEGKGIYTVAVLFAELIIMFINLGIGPATVYYVAQDRYPRQEILGNNVILGLGIGAIGALGGLILALLFAETVFPGIDRGYLMLALPLIPGGLLFYYLQDFVLGAQKFSEYNMVVIFRSLLALAFTAIALWAFEMGVAGALVAGALTWVFIDVIIFLRARKIAGGVSFRLKRAYLRQASAYGLRAHLGNILGFLNYRADMFLVNGFLDPAAVGFYSIGVGLAERLWMISSSASTVLFPKVAAEDDDRRRNEFTPLVARTVFWLTALGALVMFFLSRWVVEFLYSADFLPAVQSLQILLIGIVALSVSRVLANDISGRGRPMLNSYVSVATLTTNVILNLVWIPRYGIAGAAWASSASYSLTLLARLFLYCRISGNSWIKVILPQPTDWALYRQTLITFSQRLKISVVK
ncbi:MAG: flippase [Anaerolineae bacterium]